MGRVDIKKTPRLFNGVCIYPKTKRKFGDHSLNMKKSKTIQGIARNSREDVRTKSCLFPVGSWTALWLSLFLILVVGLTLSTSSLSQSGRQKTTTNSTTNNNASSRQTSKSTNNNRPSPKTDTDQTTAGDPEDVVQIASYLLPLRATAVAARR